MVDRSSFFLTHSGGTVPFIIESGAVISHIYVFSFLFFTFLTVFGGADLQYAHVSTTTCLLFTHELTKEKRTVTEK